MCLWYDLGQTVQTLESSNSTEQFFTLVFQQVTELKEDFEVKRFMLGLGAFLVAVDLPDSFKSQYTNIIKALVYLSQRSIEIRHKAYEAQQRQEMAEVEEYGNAAIVEDEDDGEIDIDTDDEDDGWDLDGSENMDGDD